MSRPNRSMRFGPVAVAAALVIAIFSSVPTGSAAPAGQPLADRVTDVAIGDLHICAVTDEGGVVCWGDNRAGQLGDGTFSASSTPVSVVGLADVTAIDAARYTTCALTGTGGVWCWGSNEDGVLGSGSGVTSSTVPVQVSGLATGVIAIAAGGGFLPIGYFTDYGQHVCAVLSGGSVKCWGSNETGQLGDGTSDAQSAPVEVVGLGAPAADVTAGSFHTCVRTTGGAAWCWGYNGNGQLGRGTAGENIGLGPAQVSGLDSGVIQVDAGGYRVDMGMNSSHTCAVLATGEVKCWGDNIFGQVGDGTWDDRSTPTTVVGLPGSATSVSTGSDYSCAIADGAAYCWGYDDDGQLGDGIVTDWWLPQAKLSAVPVARLGSGVARIVAGNFHACAIKADRLWCWGTPPQVSPLDFGFGAPFALGVAGLPEPADSVAASHLGHHTCAVGESGAVYCWGANGSGENGSGTINQSVPDPTKVVSLTVPATGASAGGAHGCVLLDTGEVLCWGNGAALLTQVINRRYPQVVPGLPDDIVSLTAAADRNCGLTEGGDAVCWLSLQQADIQWTTPEVITAWAGQIGVLAIADSHACAVLAGGDVQCLGGNSAGQLGDGTTVTSTTPVDVAGLSGPASALAAGPRHSCAVVAGAVQCWGANDWGQLGDGTLISSTTPVTVTGLGANVTAVTAGVEFTCALTDVGGVKCWGYNGSANLGDPTASLSSTVPVDVLGVTAGATQISAGWSHVCARLANGHVKCWGDNSLDQLGQSYFVNSHVPRLFPVGPYLRLDGQSFAIGEPLFVTGLGFAEGQSFDLILNGQVLSPAVPAVPGGGFVVNLDTSSADPGHYVLQTDANPLDAVGFDLLPGALASASAPSATPEIVVPSGLAIFTYRLYLPFAPLP